MKRILLLLALSLFTSAAFSQTFRHGVGLGVYGSFLAKNDGDPTIFSTINYTPRFHFMEKENTSLSVGLPIAIGFAGSYSYSSDYYDDYFESSMRFMINAPLMIDFNWGAGATRDTKKRFGLFAGAGAGFHYGDFVEEYYDPNDLYLYKRTRSVTSFGAAANIGMRFAVGRRQKNVEIRFSYYEGLNRPRTNVLGAGAHFNF
jgi:hypothetical protein